MYNKAILIGHLGRDPEMRYTASGKAVTNFSIATDRKWRDKSGNLQEETTWHDIVCWGKQAEFVGDHCSKGSLVFVDGEIRKRSWDDKNGVKRTTVEINAFTVRILDSRSSRKEDRPSNERPAPAPSHNEPAAPPSGADSSTADTEDDVPF
ncbi:single-stranded DNA-binding protein [bacterium]|nr:single-stranded DNA-binding protein [bacterium]